MTPTEKRAQTSAARLHEARVYGLPAWVDRARALGAFPWEEASGPHGPYVRASLPTLEVARLAERLRGVGIGGGEVLVHITPAPPRGAVREAKLEEARARRGGTPPFEKPGTRLDEEGRFSLTPEALAMTIAARAKALPGVRTVLDACTGAGGNAIAFARAGLEVTTVELDGARLALARHNARVYGVEERIRFVEGDAARVVTEAQAHLLFVDPPWGRDYDRKRLGWGALPVAESVVAAASQASYPHLWLKAPPSLDVSTVPGFDPNDGRATALFGEVAGDRHRVKMLLLCLR